MADAINGQLFHNPANAPLYQMLGLGKFNYDETLGLSRATGPEQPGAGGIFNSGSTNAIVGNNPGYAAATNPGGAAAALPEFDPNANYGVTPPSGTGAEGYDPNWSTPNQQVSNAPVVMPEGGWTGDPGMDKIIDYFLNPTKRTQAQINAESMLMDPNSGLQAQSDQYNAFFAQEIEPLIKDILQTGLRTDTQGIHDAAQREFQRDIVPQAMEGLAGGFGFGSSTGSNILAEASADLTASLADLEYKADEAAASRRMEGVPLSSNAYGGKAALTTGLADALSIAGGRFREERDSERGGRQLFNQMIQSVSTAGGSPSQPYIQGYGPDNLTSIANVLSDWAG